MCVCLLHFCHIPHLHLEIFPTAAIVEFETTAMPVLAAVAPRAHISMAGDFITHQQVDLLGGLATFISDRIIAPARRALFLHRREEMDKDFGATWTNELVGGRG